MQPTNVSSKFSTGHAMHWRGLEVLCDERVIPEASAHGTSLHVRVACTCDTWLFAGRRVDSSNCLQRSLQRFLQRFL